MIVAHRKVFADIPPNLAFVAIAVGFATFFVFDYWGNPGAGRVAAFFVGILVGIAAACRPFWKSVWVWETLALVIALHVAIIIFIRWPDVHYPAILIAPFAVIDFFIILFAVRAVGRYVGAIDSTDSSTAL